MFDIYQLIIYIFIAAFGLWFFCAVLVYFTETVFKFFLAIAIVGAVWAACDKFNNNKPVEVVREHPVNYFF